MALKRLGLASVFLVVMAVLALGLSGCGGGGSSAGGGGGGGGVILGSMVVLGYNDLGMHCMNQDFSEFMILPPYNTLRAQAIDRSGEEPRIVTSGITVTYTIPSSTRSATKTNFWTYAQQLFGAPLAPDIGLTGNGLAGTMIPTGTNDWHVTGIPITPITDAGIEDPYQLATITVTASGTTVAQTRAVVPVSWEISCNLCHNGTIAPASVLVAHDQIHGTTLQNEKPVMCGRCHAQPPLGAPGAPGVSSLSRAMHNSHSTRMASVTAQLGGVTCYACHPGQRTQCSRGVHFSRGMTCTSCHDSMAAVANPARQPWVDLPRCGTCHNRAGFEFEQAGTLYRDSKGHHGVHCAACHGSPHAITPSVVAADNVQAIAVQGHSGPIDTCTVCHRNKPDDNFEHRL